MPFIYDPIPNSPFYSPQTNSITTPSGSVIAGSGVAIDQFGFLNVASALGGTVTSITAGTGLLGGTITVAGQIDLAPATNISLGGVKVGANLLIAPDGTLSALPPGTGTVSNIVVGTGLNGGGSGPTVTIGLDIASTSQIGGVVIGSGLTVVGGLVSIDSASTTSPGGVTLATSAEVITGTNSLKAITPAGLSARTATTTRTGIVQLSDSVATNDSTVAATQTAAKLAFDAAGAAQTTANAALSRSGGTMTGIITFAAGQTFPGVALPKATTSSLGVVQVGSGLFVDSNGVVSTLNNGTVTSIVAGRGLGAPASGNPITTSGTIQLLPPSFDGTTIGGVKAGDNISIAVDGTIATTGLLKTNNPYSFNGYVWPVSQAAPALPCPGLNGQVLTIDNQITGALKWSNTGTLSSVTAGTGISVSSTATTATVSLGTVPSLTAGNYGGTALIPTFAVNQFGQITSTGQANPFVPFQTPTVTAPFILVLDFAGNNTNWQWTLDGNTTIQNPLNAVSGQTGAFVLTQNASATYTVTWGTSWKFANGAAYTGNLTPSSVDLIEFRVIAANYIVVTNVISTTS